MFSQMLAAVRDEVTDLLLKVRVSRQDEKKLAERWDDQTPLGGEPAAPPTAPPARAARPAGVPAAGPAPLPGRDGRPIGSAVAGPAQPIRREAPKVGRNDACPCGSGKKYKKCHGAAEE
jgi:preprotein translocase subunit SecA